MALRVGELYALLKLEDRDFQRGLQRAEQETRKFGRSLEDTIKRLDNLSKTINDIGQKLTTRITLPLAGLSTYLVKTASDAEQTEEKFRVSFGAMAEASLQLADQLARDQQRARVHLQNMMADAQAILAPMTENREAAARMSAALAALAVDLGSFMNISDREAFDRLISGLLGSTEATERLGISLRESVLQLEAQRLGIEANVATLGDAEKIMLRFSAIMRQSADAQTDAIRTGASLENQLKALQADVADLAAEIGRELLPYALALVQVGRDLLQHWRNLSPETKELAIRLAAIAAAAGPVALALSAVVRAAAGVGRALSLIFNVAKSNPWLLLGTLAAAWALSLEEVRQKLEELARDIGLGPLIDQLEELGAAFQELMSFEVKFDPAGASAEAMERQTQLYQQAMEEIQRVLREGFQGAEEIAEEGIDELAQRIAEVMERLRLDELVALRASRVLAQARGEMEDEVAILEDLLRAQERALTELIIAGVGPATEEYQRLYNAIGRTAASLRELREQIAQADLAEEMERQAREAGDRFHREIIAVQLRLLEDLEGVRFFSDGRGAEGYGAVVFGRAIAEALGDTWGEVETLQTQIESALDALWEYQRLGFAVTDYEVQSVLELLQELSAELDEARFVRSMDELRRRAREAVDMFGPGGVAEWLSEWRGETTLPLEFWLDPDAVQKAMRPSRVMLETQLRELDQIIDEMVRTIQDRAGRVSVFDVWADEDVRAALVERMRLHGELAALMWEEEVERLNQRLEQSLAETDVQRLIAAVTGDAFDEAAYQWRAVERAIWDVVRAGQAHGRSTEEIMRMVDELVGQYGHLAAAAQEAADPIAEIRRQLESELTTGIAIQRLIEPAFDQLGFEIQALTRAIAQAANELEGADFGAIFDAMRPEIERLQELQRLQQRQLAVQDAVNSALTGFAQGLADSNRVVQDFMRLLRWEQGGLRFDMGGLWSLGANLIAQFIGALFARPQAQLPGPRRFEAPDPYMYGVAVAREQQSELEAELRRLQQRLAAERERLASEESSLWNRLFRQDILNYWRDRIRLTEQEIANLESVLDSFDMASFLGLDPGNIARAIESGFDMADLSRLGESLEDVIRTALVRAWVTSEEMVRLQTQFRDLLQQIVDEFIQHGELRADALDPLRAVIAAIQERGEALQEVLRQLGLTSEELNEQFGRMVYNLPYGYRVERAIFEASPPRIPALAAGGIVTRPTLALIGEAGPEAVVPLDRSGIGGVYVHIERMEVQDGADFGRRLDAELRRRGLVDVGNGTAWRGRR